MSENTLGTEKISKLFIKYSIPAIISMVIVGAQTIIDGLFVSNFIGKNALASVNIAQPFMQAVIGVIMVICMGSISYTGRSLGRGDKVEAQNAFKTTFIFIAIVGLLISVSGFIFNNQIALLLGADELLLEGVSTYIKTLSIFLLPMSLMFLFGFTDRLIGKPDLYLKGSILSLIVNVVLDFVLIKYFGLGIFGASLATGIAFVVPLFIVSYPMLNKNNVLNIFKGKFDKSIILPIVYNGSSEGVGSISVAIAVYLFNKTFMGYAGASGIAAFTSVSYLAQFGTLIMFGIADGIGSVISYNYGYKKYDRLKEIMKLSYRVCSVIGVILFLVLIIFAEPLVSLFAKGNQDIIAMGVNGARLYAVSLLLVGFNIINSGYFTAIGNALGSVILSFGRGLVFIIIGILILPIILGGINGVWLTVPFAETSALIISIFLFRRNNRVYLRDFKKYKV